MEQKELWPGAGLWLNLKNIADGDFDKIEARLDEIASTSDKILWLEKFLILFNEATDIYINERFGHMDILVLATPFRNEIQRAIAERETFQNRVRSKLETLKSWLKTESKEEHRAKQSKEEIEADQALGKWTNEQAAIAIYALLRAAGLPEKHNKTAVAQLAHLLTGGLEGQNEESRV